LLNRSECSRGEKATAHASKLYSVYHKAPFGRASTGPSSGFSGGALPNVFSEEPFLVKNRGAKAVLEEPLLLQSTLEGALPNEA